MKLVATLFLGLFLAGIAPAQTATNFVVNDCGGDPHNLFSELDAGKVVVLCWVMPCATCIGPALTTYNVVGSYQSSHPGRVFYYCVDDYADTDCNSINSWCNGRGILASSWSRRFSNSAIRMSDYGSDGMPKIVVLAGPSHSVLYNVNDVVDAGNLQNAIVTGLAIPLTVEPGTVGVFTASILPNPSQGSAILSLTVRKAGTITVSISNVLGQKVSEVFSGRVTNGTHNIPIDTASLPGGVYYVSVSSGSETKTIRLKVN